MTSQASKVQRFRDLQAGTEPLLLPNPWDIGSAMILASLGFDALATTSSGSAMADGRLDGMLTRDEALAHAAAVVAAVDVPVTADLENGFADDPAGVADTVRRAVDVGLAGCSIEDFTRDKSRPIYDRELATDRIAAAVAARPKESPIVITARAENHLHGRVDLEDTITRLQAYQSAGADALYAPGLTQLEDIRLLVDSVDRPVNVLALPNGPTVRELAEVGVRRVSVGGAFAYAAVGALVEAARELKDAGTYGYWQRAGVGAQAARAAFTR